MQQFTPPPAAANILDFLHTFYIIKELFFFVFASENGKCVVI
jgi:hypothetical protein